MINSGTPTVSEEAIGKLGKRKTTFMLLGIVAVGAALRLYRIDFQSLWVDELYSVVPTDPRNSLTSVIEWAQKDQPPLFFLYIYYAFKIFGYNEVVGRVACALIGLISIPAIYLLVKEVQSKSAALFAALLTAFNYFHLYYSQELRFYSMAFLFTTLSYLFFVRIYKRGAISEFIGYIVFTSCLLYTHYFGVLIFSGQFLTFLVLLKYKRDTKFIAMSLGSGVIVALSFLPWLPVVLRDLGVVFWWVKKPSPFFVAEYFYDYTGKDAFATVVFVVLIFLFIRSVINGSINERAVGITILIWLVLPYLIPYIRSLVMTPMLANRYTIVVLPAWFVVFAIGWDKIRDAKWRYAVVITFPLAALINLAFFKKHYTRLEKDQFREASEIVISKNRFHYPIYSQLPWHFNFYFRNSEDKVIALEANHMPQAQTFWLLQANLWPEHAEAELKSLDHDFTIVDRYNLHKANAYLMKRR